MVSNEKKVYTLFTFTTTNYTIDYICNRSYKWNHAKFWRDSSFGLREPTLNYYKEVLISKDMLNSILFSLYIAGTSSIFAVIIGTLICMIIVINKKQ